MARGNSATDMMSSGRNSVMRSGGRSLPEIANKGNLHSRLNMAEQNQPYGDDEHKYDNDAPLLAED